MSALLPPEPGPASHRRYDRHATIPMDSLAYKFDIVLRGRRSTMFENRMEGN